MPQKIHISKLHKALEQHAALSERKLRSHHPEAVSWLERAGIKPGNIRHHAKKLAATGVLAGMLMANPLVSQASTTAGNLVSMPAGQLRELFAANVKALLPQTVRPLTPQEEASISRLIDTFWSIHATATLDGEHLNTSYGYIGAEQHLPRYPGDSIDQHDDNLSSGITPGKGAWGYFANSFGEMTEDLTEKEKYYVAVQTLYLPDWNTRLGYLREWYKYRKVLIVNPKNGKMIVADIADSGPSNFTEKQFGGSPEVMNYLELHDGAERGAVLLFFMDDHGNTVPLGPVAYNNTRK